MTETNTKFEGKYTESVGRRRRAVARVRLFPGKGEIIVNNKPFNEYFPTEKLQNLISAPIKTAGREASFNVSIKVIGGGTVGQAQASRLGIARCLLQEDEDVKTTLKHEGFLRRDSRKRERKKPGLRRARRARQWSKR